MKRKRPNGAIWIAPDFDLPLEAACETFGILAQRGAGKSNAGAVMAEGMFDGGVPFVAIDPVGSWYGLRAGQDGKPAGGLPIPVLGGRFGDVPLERSGGKLVADLVVDQRLSAVLDLSEFESEAAKKQFLLDFAQRLYKRNEEPLHLFLEEADDYIPQRPMKSELALLRAWENIVRRGRSRGLGCTFITQRSAAINKTVLTQVGTLIALRTTGPQDRDAVKAWLDGNAQKAEILAELPKLANGQAWVWSPHFLGAVKQVQFPRRRTFDSGATPTLRRGKGAKPSATLADTDLEGLRSAMADTVERAKADDPKALRKRIAELEQLLAKAPAPEVQPVEVPVLDASSRKRFAAFVGAVESLERRFAKVLEFRDELRPHFAELPKFPPGRWTPEIVREFNEAPPASLVRREPSVLVSVQERTAARKQSTSSSPNSSGVERVLVAVAQYPDGVTREQLSILTGYKKSTRDEYVKRLRVVGHVEKQADGKIIATDAGRAALPSKFEPLPTGAALRDYWFARLPKGEKAVLEAVLREYPAAASREFVSEWTGFKKSTRDEYLKRLRSRKLINTTPTGSVAADSFFEVPSP